MKRLMYPDIVKGITIFLVILGHSVQFGGGGGYLTNELHFNNSLFKLIYSFHMPLFMLISGFFFEGTLRRKTAIEIVWSRVTQLLIPILIWSLIPYGTSVLKGLLNGNLGMNILLQFPATAIRNFWFLWAIFWISLLVFLVSKTGNAQLLLFGVVFIAIFFVPDEWIKSEYKYMYPYFIAGMAWSRFEDGRKTFMNIIERHFWEMFSGLMVVFCLLFILFTRDTYIYTTGVSVTGKGFNQFLIDLHRWIIGFVGSALVLLSVHKAQNSKLMKKMRPLLTHFGKNSFGIYVISIIVQSYILPRLTKSFEFSYLTVLLESVSLVAFCDAVTVLLGKNKVLSWLLGNR